MKRDMSERIERCPLCDRSDCVRYQKQVAIVAITGAEADECFARSVNWRKRCFAAEARVAELESRLAFVEAERDAATGTALVRLKALQDRDARDAHPALVGVDVGSRPSEGVSVTWRDGEVIDLRRLRRTPPAPVEAPKPRTCGACAHWQPDGQGYGLCPLGHGYTLPSGGCKEGFERRDA
ncbi:MAG: hypothetical protein WC700_14980 [Gemmatimonadaceae bacterium]|jgi:hypothetical protein